MLCAAVVLVATLAILVHELGHVLGGVLARFQFYFLIWGPLRISRAGGGFTVGLNKSLALAGGMALSLPRGTINLRSRFATVVAGGPLLSLVAGVMALMALPGPLFGYAKPSGVDLMPFAVEVCQLTFGLASLLLALVTMIPGKTSGFATDGARLLRLLGGGDGPKEEVASLGLIAQSTAGLRPSDWNLEWIESLRESAHDITRSMGRSYAYASMMDRVALGVATAPLLSVQEARGLLVESLEKIEEMPSSLHSSVYLEAAFF